MNTLLIIITVVAIAGVLLISLYNALVRARQRVREGWSGIDVQLKRRADLIPTLIETVKGYAAHERATFDEIVAARNSAATLNPSDVQKRARAENVVGQAIGKLFALAEAYPDLKASNNFRDLAANLDTVESEIQMARRYYNGAARDLNIKVESFPSNLVAKSFGFEQSAFFEIEEPADRRLPTVGF